jgi:hypothetical protein
MRKSLKKWIVPLAAPLVLGLLISAARADDAYYMMIFAYQGKANLPRLAHSFATFVKVPQKDSGEPDTARLESHTISWLPATLTVRPLRLRPETGKNLDLPETLKLAVSQDADVTAWGPYRIRKELYDRAVAQIDRLKGGQIAYKAIDGIRWPGMATNCFHAISDVLDGPLLDTGTAYGNPASEMVRDHLSRWIIDPKTNHRFLITSLGLDKHTIAYPEIDKAAVR